MFRPSLLQNQVIGFLKFFSLLLIVLWGITANSIADYICMGQSALDSFIFRLNRDAAGAFGKHSCGISFYQKSCNIWGIKTRGMYFLLQSYSQVVIANHQVANSSECRTIYILFYPPFCCFKKIDFRGDFADPTMRGTKTESLWSFKKKT